MTSYASRHAWSYSCDHSVAGEGAQRLDQRRADDLVLLGHDVELAVVPAERAQVLVEPVRIVDGLDRGDDRAQQPGPLDVHGDREHVPHPGLLEEDPGVEVAGQLVLLFLDQCPAFFQQPLKVAHVQDFLTLRVRQSHNCATLPTRDEA